MKNKLHESICKINLFYDFGYISSIYPKKNVNPDIILIQGSTVQNMRERLMFLAKIIQKDVVHLKKETQIVYLNVTPNAKRK